jgi:hypothetical protein
MPEQDERRSAMDFDKDLEIFRALEREGARYVVFGAVALNLLGLARMTRDLDLFIDPATDNVDRIKAALRSVFKDPHVEEISAEDLGGDYPAVTYVPPEGDLSIDLVARLGEAFRFEDLESQVVTHEGTRIPVATPRMLYRMKKDTVRLQDRADAERLRAHFNLQDE